MQLIGMLDSPYVRRVAISLRLLGLPFEHRPISVFREFFMTPQNPFRVKEALISLLAGDIFGKTPIWPSIFALKSLYFMVSLGNLGRSLAFWKGRRLNIRDVEVSAS